MKAIERKLLRRLSELGKLTPADIERVVERHETAKAASIYDSLVSGGFVPSAEVSRLFAQLSGFQYVEIKNTKAEPAALHALPEDFLARHQVLPIYMDDLSITVAMADPNDVHLCDDIMRRTRLTLITMVADPIELRESIDRHIGAVSERLSPLSREEIALARMEVAQESEAERAETILDEDINARATIMEPFPLPIIMESRVATFHQMETVFEESDPITLDTQEKERIEQGFYKTEEVFLPTGEGLSGEDAAALTVVNHLLNDAFSRGAEMIEFTPLQRAVRLRARFIAGWRELTPYPLKYHEAVIRRLREISGLVTGKWEKPVERRFSIKTRRGDVFCAAHFEPSAFGERVVLRFPESVPLSSDPVEELTPGGAFGEELRRITQRSGGLVFITTPSARSSSRLFWSLLRWHARGGRDVLAMERCVERRISGVTQINTPTTELLLASLNNASHMRPDLVAVGSVENGTVLNALLTLSMRGIPSVGFFAAENAAIGKACIRAAKADPTVVLRGLAGLLHSSEQPLLCEHCRRNMSDEEREAVPEQWRDLAELKTADGCEHCGHSGRSGAAWISELHTPDLEAADGSLMLKHPSEERLRELITAGSLDPRELP